jgi:hypothetical protein
MTVLLSLKVDFVPPLFNRKDYDLGTDRPINADEVLQNNKPSPDPIQLSKSKMFKLPQSGLVQQLLG